MNGFPNYKAAIAHYRFLHCIHKAPECSKCAEVVTQLLQEASGDEPLYRLVEDRVKCNKDCQSPHPQQRYVQVWPKEH